MNNKNIYIIFSGNLGNNLFQYITGKIISNIVDYNIYITQINTPILNFHFFKNEKKNIFYEKEIIDIKDIFYISESNNFEKIFDLDIENRNVVLNGNFQSSTFCNKHKNIILDLFSNDINKIDKSIFKNIDFENDLLINVRLGDFRQLGWIIDFSYYEKLINSIKFRKLYITTDDPNDKYIKQFEKYKPDMSLNNYTVYRKLLLYSFFKKIVMSTSTFCWWFSFLSKNSEIYIPEIENFQYWKMDNKLLYEPFYLYIDNAIKIKTKFSDNL